MPAETASERLAEYGPATLSLPELLAQLLGASAAGIRACASILAAHPDAPALSRADPASLAVLPGVGPKRAAQVAAALELGRRATAPQDRLTVRASKDVFDYLSPRIGHLPHEVFQVLCLDARHHLLRDVRVSHGGLTSCSVLPREVFAAPLAVGACAVIVAHNHPSGDPTPSHDDIALTARLKQAGLVMGIKVLDHVIAGAGRYVSLLDNGQFASL